MDMKQPNMMTVREVAKTGLLSEHALRIMLKLSLIHISEPTRH